MDPIIKDIASNVLPMVMGGIGTGIGWLAKALIQARKDINKAHEKLRVFEQRVECLERTIYFDGD